ncbi:MAG: DUF1186 domain-containing protein [Candidatus Riflebacteria bacterium]|nr:DUF1186 domain-containing protein [Candidatus Riflebacteria bacterium]
MEISEILHELERNRGYFPEKAIREAIARKEEITHHLLRILEETVANAETLAQEEDYFAHIHAMFLLAQFRETAAYPLVIRFARIPKNQLDGLSGGILTEDLHRILASVCGGDLAPIKSLVVDQTVEEFARGAALLALQLLGVVGKIPLDDYVVYLTELMRGGLEREGSQVWNDVVSSVLDLHLVELREDIQKAYEDELVDLLFESPESVDAQLAEPKPASLEHLGVHGTTLIEDAIEEMSEWACFKPDKGYRPEKQKPPKPSPKPSAAQASSPKSVIQQVVSQKIGRNDPCPCGSGKKYKKCCGKGK